MFSMRPGEQVVEADDVPAVVDQPLGEVGSEEPGGAGDHRSRARMVRSVSTTMMASTNGRHPRR